MAGAIFVLILVLVAIFAPIVAPYDPHVATGGLRSAFLPPSRDHWLGTDGTGLDQFSRVVYGTRLALLSGLEAVFVSLVIGLPDRASPSATSAAGPTGCRCGWSRRSWPCRRR